MATRKQILIADDEPNLRRILAAQLSRDGYDVETVDDGSAAAEFLADNHVDVLISDLRMPGMDGMQLLKHVVDEHPAIAVVMITAHGTVDTAVEALKVGAFDYVTKPFDKDEFRAVVQKAARTVDARSRENVQSIGVRDRMVSQSAEMDAVYEIIDRVADTPSTVLITGESGTGKELVARALHDESGRKDKPFISVNCGAIPGELLESELFGYEKGAFTGAVGSKPGRFELANGGTLFLDEVGEIPAPMQVKLLRALQEQAFERVGGIRTLKVDVRVVAATNRDLNEAISQGSFREDLYYRLNVVRVDLPPLRERTKDIPLLAEHFVRRFNKRLNKSIRKISPEAMGRLLEAPWRGNIRELENAIERCVLFCDGETIEVNDLPQELRGKSIEKRAADEAVEQSGAVGDVGLKKAVKDAALRVERELIMRALKQTQGNVTHAARLLKISRKGLQNKMKELGLREA